MIFMRQLLSYSLHRWGGVNLSTAGAFLALLVVLLAVVIPERKKLHDVSAHAKEIQLALNHRTMVDIADNPDFMANAVYATFPAEVNIDTQLEKFFDIAFENDIYIDAVDYQLETESPARLTRYRINLPMTASYTNVRKFIRQVLQQLPNAALDQISMSRHNPQDTEVNAKLQFTLYFRA